MARVAVVVGLVVGIAVGVVGGAALQIHATDEGDMGGKAGLTGVDGSDQAAVPEPTDVVPDPTVDSPPAQQPNPPQGIWDKLARCESNERWNIVNPPYYGGLQFDLPSWRAAGGSGRPDQASRTEQIRIGQNWQRIRGWSAWPICSRVVGLR